MNSDANEAAEHNSGHSRRDRSTLHVHASVINKILEKEAAGQVSSVFASKICSS